MEQDFWGTGTGVGEWGVETEEGGWGTAGGGGMGGDLIKRGKRN